MFQTGLVSVSFRSLSPEEVMIAASKVGLKQIEWGSDVHAPCGDVPRLQEIARLQKKYGITCSSYGSYYRIGANATEDIHAFIQAAKILGTRILRVWCGTKAPEAYSPQELETLYAQCRELAAIAENEDVVLCMESHHGTMTDNARSAYALMQAVNSPAFRMYYQPNQFHTPEENIEYAKLLAEYTYHIHVFNWDSEHRYSLKEAIPLWREYLSCFAGDHVLLLEFMPDDSVDSLPTEAAALFEMIGE